MYKIILIAAEETSAMSVFEGTNPWDLIPEDRNIALPMVSSWKPVVEDFGLQLDSDILMSRVSDGSCIPEHSEDLQVHGTQC